MSSTESSMNSFMGDGGRSRPPLTSICNEIDASPAPTTLQGYGYMSPPEPSSSLPKSGENNSMFVKVLINDNPEIIETTHMRKIRKWFMSSPKNQRFFKKLTAKLTRMKQRDRRLDGSLKHVNTKEQREKIAKSDFMKSLKIAARLIKQTLDFNKFLKQHKLLLYIGQVRALKSNNNSLSENEHTKLHLLAEVEELGWQGCRWRTNNFSSRKVPAKIVKRRLETDHPEAAIPEDPEQIFATSNHGVFMEGNDLIIKGIQK